MKSKWNHTTLGCICEIINGKNQKEVEAVDGRYPIYGSGGIMGFATSYLCPARSTIIGRKGTIDRPLYVSEPFWNVDTAFGLCPKEGVEPKFLYYLCKSINWQKYNKSTTLPSLVKSDLLKIPVWVPDSEEQKRIVEELDLICDIISKKKAQILDLDCLAKSLFNRMFGNPITNEKGWTKKRLGEVCTIERGGSPRPIKDFITTDPDGLNWIKIGDAVEGSKYINSTKEKIKKEGLKKTRLVHKGDFILSNSMSFGRPYILGIDGCIHDGWLVLHDNQNSFNSCYLYYYLSSDSLYNEFKRLAVGGVVNNLNSGLVRGVSVSVPPIEIQNVFASKESAIENEKCLISNSINDLKALFESRMAHYFSKRV